MKINIDVAAMAIDVIPEEGQQIDTVQVETIHYEEQHSGTYKQLDVHGISVTFIDSDGHKKVYRVEDETGSMNE